MSEPVKKKKDSNELLNILLIVIGIAFLFLAVMQFLAWAGIIVPAWITALAGEAGPALSFFGSQGLISAILGFWAIVSGIGMFGEEEWAMGQALVVLSIMAMTSVSPIIGWILTPASFDVAYWPNYITIFAFVLGVLGFFWLLATRKRYA
jgi:cytochrome c biogenesis protein CcdA